MSDKSKLIHELEWALTLVKYSPKPNYDKVAEHFNNAQQQLKILNIPVVSNNEVSVCANCRYNDSDKYHDIMYCRECRQHSNFCAK